jgi:hypothetical protein
MYLAKNLDKSHFEIALLTAAGEYTEMDCFERHMAARDYWLYVLACPGAFPWGSDYQASEWLKRYEETT